MFSETATNLRIEASSRFRVKICGITQPDQGEAIARMGASALGFMGVPESPRYIAPVQMRSIVEAVGSIDRVGVFANVSVDQIAAVVETARLNGVQLHGSEDPQFCQQVRLRLPNVELIKAFRIRTSEQLRDVLPYQDWVDTLLLDAYVPHVLGGTGHQLDWASLQQFQPDRPWLLAGGITPDNVLTALDLLQPDGIDLSSGVEVAPGHKDLAKVARLLETLRSAHPHLLV